MKNDSKKDASFILVILIAAMLIGTFFSTLAKNKYLRDLQQSDRSIPLQNTVKQVNLKPETNI